jgi:hypothetical protein
MLSQAGLPNEASFNTEVKRPTVEQNKTKTSLLSLKCNDRNIVRSRKTIANTSKV